jgi:lipopolysaccharide/colanic/teichoic acid biosynthesis glycosyltransferase
LVVSSHSSVDATELPNVLSDDGQASATAEEAARGSVHTVVGVAAHDLLSARSRRRLYHVSRLIQIIIKRVVDVVMALALMVALLPVLLVVAVAIKLDSPGPLCYNRVRVGKNGRHFTMYKFRTMSSDAERRLCDLQHLNAGGAHMVKIKDDPRVTRIGRLLRVSSIDETPQLLNVLMGDMSVIGPRPQTPEEVAHYTDAQRVRLTVLPGITGLWQVKDRHNPSFEQWIAWDVHYIARWNLWLDLCIAGRTFVMIVTDIGRAVVRAVAR